MIDKIAAIIIENKRILAAREYGLDVFFIPGGKRNDGESDLEALEREIEEELGAKIKNPKYHKTYFSEALDGREVRVKAYFVELASTPQACSEIEEILWVDRNSYKNHKLGNVLMVIIPEMIKDGML